MASPTGRLRSSLSEESFEYPQNKKEESLEAAKMYTTDCYWISDDWSFRESAITADIISRAGACKKKHREATTRQVTKRHKSLQEVESAAPRIKLVPREAKEEKRLEKMSRHEQNLLILTKFLKVRKKKEGGYDGVFFATSFPWRWRTNAKIVEKMVKKMATTLAMISLHKWILDGSTYLEVKARNSNFNVAFQETTFKSVAMFILHAFDVEDLDRFSCYDKLKAEYTKFYNENMSHLKNENPYKLIAEGKINLDGFPLLREQDVGHILRMHGYGNGGKFFGVVGLMYLGWQLYAFCPFKESCHGRFVDLARTVLLQYVSMEKDMTMYSILDGGCAFDTIRDKDLSNIKKILELGKCDEIVAVSFELFLANLIEARYDNLTYQSFAMTYGMREGNIGSFADEVFELVNIADLRRRFFSHRFISRHHILWAVCLTELKDFVDRLVEGLGLRDLVEEPATCPPYSVYISAQTTAKIHGVEFVAVEHIVVATVFEMSQRKNLNEFNNTQCVKEFLDAVRYYRKESGITYKGVHQKTEEFWSYWNKQPSEEFWSHWNRRSF